MKTSLSILLISILASSLFADQIKKAKNPVEYNAGNPTKSVANKEDKVRVEKTVKAKAVRGDYPKQRKLRRITR